MKKAGILFVFVMLTVFVQGYAQKQGWNADTIMQRVKRTERTYFAFQVKMDMTIVKKDSTSAHKSTLISWEKVRMNISNSDSAGNLTSQLIQLVDTVWTYSSKSKEIEINYDFEPRNSSVGVGMFTISFGLVKQVLKEIVDDTIAVVSMYPANPEQESWNHVDVRVDLKTYRLIGYTKFQKDGGRTICDLEYTSINQPLALDLFVFDLKNYPTDVKVIDNRHH